jgi:hypothetical protein
MDTNETLPALINDYEYLDSHETLQEEEDMIFIDCLGQSTIADLRNESGWLQLGEVCASESAVNCVFQSRQEILDQDGDPWLQANATPTLQGCKAMTINTVFQEPSTCMSVVGQANLSICGNWDNFVGDILSPKNKLQLGGMAAMVFASQELEFFIGHLLPAALEVTLSSALNTTTCWKQRLD